MDNLAFYEIVKEFSESIPYQVTETRKGWAVLSCRYCTLEVHYNSFGKSEAMDPQNHDGFCLWRRANQLVTEEQL